MTTDQAFQPGSTFLTDDWQPSFPVKQRPVLESLPQRCASSHSPPPQTRLSGRRCCSTETKRWEEVYLGQPPFDEAQFSAHQQLLIPHSHREPAGSTIWTRLNCEQELWNNSIQSCNLFFRLSSSLMAKSMRRSGKACLSNRSNSSFLPAFSFSWDSFIFHVV